jgi:hypothetical protein
MLNQSERFTQTHSNIKHPTVHHYMTHPATDNSPYLTATEPTTCCQRNHTAPTPRLHQALNSQFYHQVPQEKPWPQCSEVHATYAARRLKSFGVKGLKTSLMKGANKRVSVHPTVFHKPWANLARYTSVIIITIVVIGSGAHIGLGLLKQTSPATSTLHIRPSISTTQFPCVFFYRQSILISVGHVLFELQGLSIIQCVRKVAVHL